MKINTMKLQCSLQPLQHFRSFLSYLGKTRINKRLLSNKLKKKTLKKNHVSVYDRNFQIIFYVHFISSNYSTHKEISDLFENNNN